MSKTGEYFRELQEREGNEMISDYPEPPNWMDMKDAIKYTTLSESTLKRAIRNGELQASRVTGKILFKIDMLDRWLLDK